MPFPSPGDLPHPGIEPKSPALQADALTSEPPGKFKEGYYMIIKGSIQEEDITIVNINAMAPDSSTLAWKIPWIEEPGRLQSMGWQRVGQD